MFYVSSPTISIAWAAWINSMRLHVKAPRPISRLGRSDKLLALVFSDLLMFKLSWFLANFRLEGVVDFLALLGTSQLLKDRAETHANDGFPIPFTTVDQKSRSHGVAEKQTTIQMKRSRPRLLIVSGVLCSLVLRNGEALAMKNNAFDLRYSNTVPQVAYRRLDGKSPGIVFLPGFCSSMLGRKSDFLYEYCQQLGLEYVCFDYRAFGESKGQWATDASISNWLDDTIWILDHVVQSNKAILVGSSMGGWLGLLAARRRPNRFKGIVLLAPAVDMTRYYPDPSTQRHHPQKDEAGRIYYEVPNSYDDQSPYIVYESFLQDGDKHCILDDPVAPFELEHVPIHILHGANDFDVPIERSKKVVDALRKSKDTQVHFTTINDGDHRLSEPRHLETLKETIDGIVGAQN